MPRNNIHITVFTETKIDENFTFRLLINQINNMGVVFLMFTIVCIARQCLYRTLKYAAGLNFSYEINRQLFFVENNLRSLLLNISTHVLITENLNAKNVVIILIEQGTYYKICANELNFQIKTLSEPKSHNIALFS